MILWYTHYNFFFQQKKIKSKILIFIKKALKTNQILFRI